MTQKTIITPEYPNGISVEYTAQEIAQQQIDAQNEVVRKEAEEQAKQAKINAKASALAKLSALGLTEEEVNSII
jgi:hypothetical protein